MSHIFLMFKKSCPSIKSDSLFKKTSWTYSVYTQEQTVWRDSGLASSQPRSRSGASAPPPTQKKEKNYIYIYVLFP